MDRFDLLASKWWHIFLYKKKSSIEVIWCWKELMRFFTVRLGFYFMDSFDVLRFEIILIFFPCRCSNRNNPFDVNCCVKTRFVRGACCRKTWRLRSVAVTDKTPKVRHSLLPALPNITTPWVNWNSRHTFCYTDTRPPPPRFQTILRKFTIFQIIWIYLNTNIFSKLVTLLNKL